MTQSVPLFRWLRGAAASWVAGMTLVATTLCAHLAHAAEPSAPTRPIREGSVKSGPANLHYWIQGEGSPLVLLSGGPGFASYMQPVMAELSANHQVIMLDQRGTGASTVFPMDESTLTIQALVDDLEVLRNHLGIAQWTVVGHSWGGALAMFYGTAHPQAARALVLVGSAGLTTDFQAYFYDNIHLRLLPSDLDADAYWRDPGRKRSEPDRTGLEVRRGVLPGYFYNRKNMWPFVQFTEQRGSFNPLVNRIIFREYGTKNLGPAMMGFDKPVLLVMGRQDPIGETTQYQIKAAAKQAQLSFIEKSGHFPWIEEPAAFYKTLRAFLDGI